MEKREKLYEGKAKVLYTTNDPELLIQIKTASSSINSFLKNWFQEIGISLVDFKLEFGRYRDQVLLADEITPDGCRLWDIKTEEKLDKDRFRRDLGKIEEAYQEVYRRICQKTGCTDLGD